LGEINFMKKSAQSKRRKVIAHTAKVVGDDVFTDVFHIDPPKLVTGYDTSLELLWQANPDIHDILKKCATLEDARDGLYRYLEKVERGVFDIDNDLHILEKATIRDCIRVFKSIIGPINEKLNDFSALDVLWKLAQSNEHRIKPEVSVAFLMEFIHLFSGVAGRANLYTKHGGVKKSIPEFSRVGGREAALRRSENLDEMSFSLLQSLMRFPSGLDSEVINWRVENRRRILEEFNAKEEDWDDYQWHLDHVIKKPDFIFKIIDVSENLKKALAKAWKNHLPMGVTPYYLHLMDRSPDLGHDHAVRAQVLPSPEYVDSMSAHRKDREFYFDFMGEHDTSPIDLITRRYPLICILKPYNTCSQICVYCQRNWEIDECMSPDAMAGDTELAKAIQWLRDHPAVGEVLITGGDPMVMDDQTLERILDEVASIDHIYRIRIGTRTPVVLPMRWTDKATDIVAKHHEPGRREIVVVTHFEHSYEITPEAMEAVRKIRLRGLSVYNQQVFTTENSRRFETARLRLDLRKIGVDPYYTFNTKGKKETRRYMVPIARILQERKEEARLLPGLDRTDEPVFNVPRLGKNHLCALQDHRLSMILANGSRVYEFHPWEKNITPVPPYNYVDVPIYEYLQDLAARGENVEDYKTIWYYY
jgi:lysine 2,3-aminomutase